MPRVNPPADDGPEQSPPSVDADVPPADAAGADAPPQWIEVGSPQRRTAPPAWSAEAQADAWSRPVPEADAEGSAASPESAGEPWVQGPMDPLPPEDPAAADDPAGAGPAAADADDETEVLPAQTGIDDEFDVAAGDADTAELAALDGQEEWAAAASEPAEEPTQEMRQLAAMDGSDSVPGPTGADQPAEPEDRATTTSPAEPEEPDDRVTTASPGEPEGAGEEQVAVAAPGPDHEDETVWQVVDEPIAPGPEEPATSDERAVTEEPVASANDEPAGPANDEPADPGSDEDRPPPAPVTPGATAPAAADPGNESATERTRSGTVQGALQVLVPHLREHRAALITGLAAGLLSVWLLVALPFPIMYAIDAALGDRPSSTLTAAVIALVVMVAAQAVAGYGAVAALGRVGARAATELRVRLIGHVHRLTPSGSGPGTDDEPGPEEQSSRPLVDDVARLRDLVSHSGPRIAAGLLVIASLLVVLLIVDLFAALVVAVTGAVFALAARPLTRRARASQRHATAEGVMLEDTTAELVDATRTIQSYGLEQHARRALSEVDARAGRARAASRRADAGLSTLAHVLTGLGLAAMLLVGGTRLTDGAITPGDLALSLAYLLLTMVALRELSRLTGTLSSAAVAGDRIQELLDRRGGIPEPRRAQSVDRVGGGIVYSAIHAFGRHGRLFDTVSLVIPAGQHVGLMGRTGAESAALISYLQRFEQPDTGRVLLDRYDTRAVSLADLRRQLAVVQREPALFTDTVRENIRIGRPGASDDEVAAAARRAGADAFISLLPEGYDTVLARRGAALTDGQRRHLAIARALLRDAPVVVLDRADADLAPSERDGVLAALAALLEGRTALVAGGRAETLAAMDRVLWFEGGEVAEDDAPAALAADPDSQYATWLRTIDENVR